jgi:HEAT repeat protein
MFHWFFRATRLAASLALAAAMSSIVIAQQSKVPPPMRPADSGGQAFGPASVARAARQALQAGRAEEAVSVADRVLIRLPGEPEAALVKVEALFALRNPNAALDTYDAFSKARGGEDLTILRVVGREVLRLIGETPNELAGPAALGALAQAGDASARKTLQEQAASTKDPSMSMLSREALARVGDSKAIAELVSLASSDSTNTSVSALNTLGDLRERRAAPAVLKGLATQNVLTRLAAVNTAGRIKLTEAKPLLLEALKDRPYLLRLQAAGALMTLGEKAGAEALTQALSSEFPDARLAAATALSDADASDKSWHASIRPILTNPDGLNRFRAAGLLLPVDRAAALDVLTKGAIDPNPTIRAEVARILAEDAKVDLTLLRGFLRDVNPRARLYAGRRLSRYQPSTEKRSP